MADKKPSFGSYTDSQTWQASLKLAKQLYSGIEFAPEHGMLVNFIRKNSVLNSTNLARGYHKRSFEDKISMYYTSIDLLTNLENALILAQELKIISSKEFDNFKERITTVQKMTFSTIKNLKQRIADSREEEEK